MTANQTAGERAATAGPAGAVPSRNAVPDNPRSYPCGWACANLAQFMLVTVNALIGGTLGQERTVLPLLATQAFHLAALTSALTFILAFGAVKAVIAPLPDTTRAGVRTPVRLAGVLAAALGSC